jgi:demethoxyubiquinone hydroxylase (CLK1/Coq7/Cat5 family)
MSRTPSDTLVATSASSACSLTVLYDGACPLCRREIAVYRGLTPVDPMYSLGWTDVSADDAALPAGGDRARYLARFHVQTGEGRLLSGAAAFVALWRTLPGWRLLARLADLPGVTPLMELGYLGFLQLRPAMQRAALAFEPPPAGLAVPDDLIGELRSDHAGETGAVWIYHGVLAFSRDTEVREFARRHRATEADHRQKMARLLPWPKRSRLLVPWRAAGFVTGALPALFGPRAVYATIGAVETFVDHHYQQQIDRLAGRDDHAALRDLLRACQADECEHRDEALGHENVAPGSLLRAWCALVGSGSAVAVKIARQI